MDLLHYFKCQNGLPVIHYNANGQRHRWTETDDKTVFWVISIDQAYSSPGFISIKLAYEHPDFHNDDNGKLFEVVSQILM